MQFGTAKAVLAFLALLGWALSALGAIAFFYVFTQFGFLQALSAVVIVAMGVFIVATSQMGLAQIATAENTGALLDAIRNGQTELGVPRTNQGKPQSSVAPKKVGDRVKVFKGYEILKAETGVSVAGKNFVNVLEAEKWVNGQEE